MKLLCRIFGHKWGMFVCLRCREIRPEVREFVTALSGWMAGWANFWMKLKELKAKRDLEYEEMMRKPETTGEILKRLGIKREKPVIKAEKPETITTIRVEKHSGLFNKWEPFLKRLYDNDGMLKINKNEYYGKIRGMDILIEARKDFKRLGIKAEVKLMGDYGTIRLLSGPYQEAR